MCVCVCQNTAQQRCCKAVLLTLGRGATRRVERDNRVGNNGTRPQGRHHIQLFPKKIK